MDDILKMLPGNFEVIDKKDYRKLLGNYNITRVVNKDKRYSLYIEKIHGKKYKFEEQVIWNMAEKEMILKYFCDVLSKFHNIEAFYFSCDKHIVSNIHNYLAADLSTGFVKVDKQIMPLILTNIDYMNYDWFQKEAVFEAPDSIITRCQHLMLITGLRKSMVLCYSGKLLNVRFIDYDQLLCDDLIKQSKVFYENNICKKIKPPMHADDIKLHSYYYRDFFNSPVVEITGEMLELIERRENLKQSLDEKKSVKKEYEKVNSEIKLLMSNHSFAAGYGYNVSYKGKIPENCGNIKRRLYVRKEKK